MTRRYALAGYPVDRSPSPAMHNAAFAALDLDAEYGVRPTHAGQALELVDELRTRRWHGANVTIPLKTLIAPHVRLDAVAARAGAVNTVWHSDAGLAGALTDVDGVREPLRGAGLRPGAAALIIGSGGAARAAVLALEQIGATVHLAARSPQKAAAILDALRPRASGQTLALGDQEALAALFGSLDAIIQATPVGRNGTAHPLPWRQARPPLIAFDMVYLPVRTPFLVQAEEAGAATVEGWRMLLEQGARAFELWTGQTAPRDLMGRSLLEHLEGQVGES